MSLLHYTSSIMKKFYCLLIAFVGLRIACAQPTPSQVATIDSTLIKLHQRGMFNGAFLLAKNVKISNSNDAPKLSLLDTNR